jgi:hypothetical protein
MTPASAIAARLAIPSAQPRAVGHVCAICRRPLARARSRHHRACYDASPEKSRLARAAAAANPAPGGHPRRSR